MLHSRDSVCGPWQTFPPCFGGGFLHNLCLYCFPPPQLLLHWRNLPHEVQPPSTDVMEQNIIILAIIPHLEIHALEYYTTRADMFFRLVKQTYFLGNMPLKDDGFGGKIVKKPIFHVAFSVDQFGSLYFGWHSWLFLARSIFLFKTTKLAKPLRNNNCLG